MGPQLAASLAFLLLPLLEAQTLRHDQLAAGAFLVAPRKALDPNFAQTVVLIVQYDDENTLGLIINQPSQVTMARLFPERKEPNDGRVYAGGPVGRAGMLALLRSKTKPPEAQHVFEDIYLVSNRKLFENAVASNAPGSQFRVFLGYSGWGPGQLESELDHDMWHLFAGDPAAVFDPAPDTLWPKLIRRTELRIARQRTPRPARRVVSWKE